MIPLLCPHAYECEAGFVRGSHYKRNSNFASWDWEGKERQGEMCGSSPFWLCGLMDARVFCERPLNDASPPFFSDGPQEKALARIHLRVAPGFLL